MKQLLLGNEALARGVWEAGATVATAYPGTPSTEVTENLAKYDGIRAEWSPNEKVALEVAVGASIGGARSVCCMKHVGLNVAADPLFTASYTGVNGGLVIIVADDPGMHSSQNEQDSRMYAKAAHIPMLEPSDSQEAYEFVQRAFDISEQYDTPVLLRITTRVAHSRSLVEVKERREVPLKEYQKDITKYVMMPSMAKGRHVVVEKRMNRLAEDSNAMTDLNRIEMNDPSVGIITAGISYQYVCEALPHASVLKIGLVHPLPIKVMQDFAQSVEKVYVVEELEPFMEEAAKVAGIDCQGKELFTRQSEYSVSMIADRLGNGAPKKQSVKDIPPRPPVLCPGCPHRGTFYVLNQLKLSVTGDIGCYTLGALGPLSAVDTVLCMGASIGMGFGMEKARGREFARRSVAVIGDSTFIHSGITPLIDAVYNEGHTTIIIVDNSTTGMTGHQEHPATGKNIYGEIAPAINLVDLCKAVGVQDIKVVDSFDLAVLTKAVKDSLDYDGVSVVVSRRPCILLDRKYAKAPLIIDYDKCIHCRLCMKLGCPAIADHDGMIKIDRTLCVGCELCMQVCPRNAIGEEHHS